MRLIKFINEQNKEVPITSLEGLYKAIFTRGKIDPNKILEYAPYVKADEDDIRDSIKKLHKKKTTNITLRELKQELDKYGEVHNDIIGDRLAYTVVIEDKDKIDELFKFIDKHQLDLFGRSKKFAEKMGEISIRAWSDLLLGDFITYLLKEEYAEMKRQPIVDISGVDNRVLIADFLQYINENKDKEVKVTKEE